MNSSGPPGLPELIPRSGQIINIGRGGTITLGRHSMPGAMGGGHGGMGAGNQGQVNPVVRRPAGTPGKLMRLRCRFRPLHDAYVKNGVIVEDDADVIFVCGDGHQLKAHKVIMASSSKFFAKIFEDQAGGDAVVSVPDVKADVMKLILQLTYRDRVILTMRQIKEVGEFITVFGMAWTQFGYEEYHGDEPMSSLPMPPVPMKPVELPRAIKLNSSHNPSPRPQPSQPQQQPQLVRKVYTGPGARMVLQQNFVNNGNEEEEEDSYQLQIGQQGQNQNERHSRKSRLVPRAGTEGEDIVEPDEEEDPENLIRDWMNKLGKRDSSSSSSPAPTPSQAGSTGPGPVKRMRNEDEPKPTPPNTCSVCRQQFRSETAWRWHEDRHVGHKMFKCKFCDQLNNTPKECWLHERDKHGFSGLNFNTPNQPAPQPPQLPPQQQKPQQQPPPQPVLTPRPAQMGTPKFANSPGQQLSKRIKMTTMKKVQAQKKKEAINKLSQIGIGDSNGAETLDSKKLKQLHWLYVCERCDNCADSASKATMHYNRCFPNKEKNFEDTVTKYRQGFYGKSNCPLCPRRYPQNSGFMIHCGHQHQQYRKLFTHVGGADDQLKCNNCKEKYAEPVAFHEHLETDANGTFYCGDEPGEEAVPETTPAVAKAAPTTRSSSEGKATRPRLPRRPESPMESKASYKVQFHTPPRSARLANRVQAEASAEAAKAKATAAVDINFPPVDCPVCGDSDLPNISAHLQTKHKDLNVDVTRISSELLRCKGCTITFDICDLLDHKNCLNQQQEGEGADGEESNSSSGTGGVQRRSSVAAVTPAPATSSTSGKAVKAVPVVADVDSLPPGVGRSPIEKIEMNDLLSIQAIRSALKCLICGTTAKKLGVIADCLRAHGVHRCSLCFNSYCSKTDYALHLKKCHGSGSNKLKCPLCPKSFANAGQTSGHMYSTHWLQILRQNEALNNEDDETEKKEEDEKNVSTGEAAAANNDGDGDTSLDQDDDEKDEKIAEDEDDNQAEVSGVVASTQEEEEDVDDDDEDKMEIDESPQPDTSSPDKDSNE